MTRISRPAGCTKLLAQFKSPLAAKPVQEAPRCAGHQLDAAGPLADNSADWGGTRIDAAE